MKQVYMKYFMPEKYSSSEGKFGASRRARGYIWSQFKLWMNINLKLLIDFFSYLSHSNFSQLSIHSVLRLANFRPWFTMDTLEYACVTNQKWENEISVVNVCIFTALWKETYFQISRSSKYIGLIYMKSLLC